MKEIGDTALGAVVTPVIVTDADGIISELNIAAELSMRPFKKLLRIDRYIVEGEISASAQEGFPADAVARFHRFLCGSDIFCAYCAELYDARFWLFFIPLQQGADLIFGDLFRSGAIDHAFILRLLSCCLERKGTPNRSIIERRIYQLRDVSLRMYRILFGTSFGSQLYDARTVAHRLSRRMKTVFDRFGYELSTDISALDENGVYPTRTPVAADIILQLVLHMFRFSDDRRVAIRIYEADGAVCTELTMNRASFPLLNYSSASPEELVSVNPQLSFELFVLRCLIKSCGMSVSISRDDASGAAKIVLADPMRMTGELPLGEDEETERFLDGLLHDII